MARKALVALDRSDISRALAGYAFMHARKFGLDKLDFIHVIRPSEPAREVNKDLEKMLESESERSGVAEVSYTLITEFGVPYDRIIDRAEKEDYETLLIGHRGMSNVARFFLGSVAAKVVRHAPCSVVVYRPRS